MNLQHQVSIKNHLILNAKQLMTNIALETGLIGKLREVFSWGEATGDGEMNLWAGNCSGEAACGVLNVCVDSTATEGVEW